MDNKGELHIKQEIQMSHASFVQIEVGLLSQGPHDFQVAAKKELTTSKFRIGGSVLPEVEVRRTGTGKNAVLPD